MSEKLTDDRLREIKERAEKATKGPCSILCAVGVRGMTWYRILGPMGQTGPCIADVHYGGTRGRSTYGPYVEANAELMASAFTDIPDLLAEVARLREQLMVITTEAQGYDCECRPGPDFDGPCLSCFIAQVVNPNGSAGLTESEAADVKLESEEE